MAVFPGRILFLSTDPAKVAAQLAGIDFDPAEAGELRADISTDEITPIRSLVFYDERLGDFPYTGFVAGGARPIGQGAIRQGGFSVVVAGSRYGKGSSREHSPAAELAAGVRLVIAESFERIYRQNADNLGLLTSTDFGLIARIRRGEDIDLEKIVSGRDAITADILRAGGLLRYGRRLADLARLSRRVPEDSRPCSYFEKILARHLLGQGEEAVPAAGKGAFLRADLRFIHEYYTAMCSHLLEKEFGRSPPFHDPGSIIAFEDHLAYADRSRVHVENALLPHVHELVREHRAFAQNNGLRAHGALAEGSEGISHALMAERYALPGQLVVGTDSHTPHAGALGCLAFGVGTTDMANAMVTGIVRITIPEVVRVELDGGLPPGVSAKDLALHLLQLPELRSGAGLGKVFEFAGSAIAHLNTDERATLTNMTAEMGGFTGIVAPDAETARFLRERRGLDIAIEPWMRSDPGARYALHLRVDCSALEPMVAAPGDPGNGLPISRVQGPIRCDIAYGGSCTAGKREDFDRYHEVLSWAAGRGLKVPPGVRFFLQFGTTDVRDYCEARGYLDIFREVGAELLQPGCGACANCGPGSSVSPDEVTVSAINRNFPGRSGPGRVWLASPATVAASAVLGELGSFEELRRRAGKPADTKEDRGDHD